MMTAKVVGAEALSARFRLMELQAGALVKEAAMAAAEVIRAEASVLAPRSAGSGGRGGHMADHINTQIVGSTAQFRERVRIGPAPDQWPKAFTEEGTSKMAAQPFLRPALDTKEHEALDAFARTVKGRLP